MMTNKEWFQLWDDTNHKFRWFIEKYCPDDWLMLEVNRTKGNRYGMLGIMGKIWFELPDNEFNITVNPHGWTEFLALIEEFLTLVKK